MRRSLLLFGAALLVVTGAVWSLQGAGVLGGSVMSEEPRWLVIGSVLVVIGVAIGYRGYRSPR